MKLTERGGAPASVVLLLALLTAGRLSAQNDRDREALQGIEHLMIRIEASRKDLIVGEPFEIYVRIWNRNPKPVIVREAIWDPGHGVLRIELSRRGTFEPVRISDPCTRDQAPHLEHSRLMPFPPYLVRHYWYSEHHGYRHLGAFLDPGVYHLRLAFEGRQIGNLEELHIRRSASPEAERLERQLRYGHYGAYPLGVLDRLTQVLPEAGARQTYQFFRDRLEAESLEPTPAQKEAARARIRLLAEDPAFHLRRKAIKVLEPSASDDAAHAEWSKKWNVLWPSEMKPEGQKPD